MPYHLLCVGKEWKKKSITLPGPNILQQFIGITLVPESLKLLGDLLTLRSSEGRSCGAEATTQAAMAAVPPPAAIALRAASQQSCVLHPALSPLPTAVWMASRHVALLTRRVLKCCVEHLPPRPWHCHCCRWWIRATLEPRDQQISS